MSNLLLHSRSLAQRVALYHAECATIPCNAGWLERAQSKAQFRHWLALSHMDIIGMDFGTHAPGPTGFLEDVGLAEDALDEGETGFAPDWFTPALLSYAERQAAKTLDYPTPPRFRAGDDLPHSSARVYDYSGRSHHRLRIVLGRRVQTRTPRQSLGPGATSVAGCADAPASVRAAPGAASHPAATVGRRGCAFHVCRAADAGLDSAAGADHACRVVSRGRAAVRLAFAAWRVTRWVPW